LGEQLILRKIITQHQLQTALKVQQNDGGRLGPILIYLGYATRQEIEANLPDIR
jgi:hypothetical protein